MDIPEKGIKFLAPAKVNLILILIAKREDGYHEIQTLMQRIRLFDTLIIRKNPKGPLVRCPGYPELEGDANVIAKAIRLLEKELARSLPIEVELRKKIPLGAGLGGGSSDAAAILLKANDLLGKRIPQTRLMEIAARLGSDIPFFLLKKTALGRGRGEILEPWTDFPKWWYVLVYPGFPVSTAWAYSQVKIPLTKIDKLTNIQCLIEKGEIPEAGQFQNDLERCVLPAFPILNEIKKALLRQGCRQALMSGSGSTLFGIWEDEAEARKAFRALNNRGWGRVFLARGF
jgi:4-diphosphocytidyl-2-C-methyl-D-erythritol kinase